MTFEMIIAAVVGALIIGYGYMIRTKQTFALLAGFLETWTPVNKETLSHRVGLLVMTLGVLIVVTALATHTIGAIAATISGVLAAINVIGIIAVIVLDQMGL